MASRQAARRGWLNCANATTRSTSLRVHAIPSTQRQLMSTGTNTRPTVPFLSTSETRNTTVVRTYASERTKTWLRREVKMFFRLSVLLYGGGLCVYIIYYFIREEKAERDYPTPHEWNWRSRHMLRDAHSWADPAYKGPVFPKTLEVCRNLLLWFERPEGGGEKIPRLMEQEDPDLLVPWEFIPHDLSAMSEEWRRGYYETMMLAAKAAEYCEGWMRDVYLNNISAPEFVIGPSNPRPLPIPPGAPAALREEDCELAYPPADRFYLKIFATKGFTARQRIQAALEYANFIELKRRPEESEALYKLALAEATAGMDPSKLPYDSKTLILKDGIAPSLNVLDAITGMANYKARNGDVKGALPIYLSLLKARRSLSETPPPTTTKPKTRSRSPFQQLVDLMTPPAYPPPPPDGSLPPWRSPEERCQEAALHIYIGEILYATSSKEDGLAWTREGVDVVEEQMHQLPTQSSHEIREMKKSCRTCLQTGLENWTVMVERLIEEDKRQREKGPGVLSFWRQQKDEAEAEGRWDAESAVVAERVRRTRDLLDTTRPLDEGILGWFKA